ncbi:MAG TPA: inositol monophosphatase family protein, partial [Tepidisphaeraceae bacterium]|nr:inositol monophosphatase family protein [Tepidisphaeraceae bacterium]
VVGCLVKNRPLVGAVYLPPLDQLFCAAEGLGATWNGRTCRVSNATSLSECTLVSSSVMRAIRRSDAFEHLANNVRLTRGWGDVFGYMLLARGQAEIMLDPTISLWDIAGVAPIVREAGGFFGNWKGESTVDGPDCAAIVPGVKDVVLDVLRREKRK